ncbi:MAG: lysine--tRNA ligase, partial [Pseudomonadota bacterium]
TFAEVARTTMVMHSYRELTGRPAKLIAVSDDMDGLRKVPDNLPNQEMLQQHLNQPLSMIPDPFAQEESFGAYMNKRLQSFLDKFGFEYEFRSSTDFYKNGKYNHVLKQILAASAKINDIILPTLGQERQQTYSPFLPICPDSGQVLQVKVVKYDVASSSITYIHPRGDEITTSVLDGNCKLQWKVDWPMRWLAFDVDYEMHGKDLIPSADIAHKICKALDATGPVNYVYELFLDEHGQKISKSKGNGISIEQWLEYAPAESLSLYMFQSPRKAKRLHFDVIPKAMDEYMIYLTKYHDMQGDPKQLENALWHIHNGAVPNNESHGISFSLLLNLVNACNAENEQVMRGYVDAYATGANPEQAPMLSKMIKYAIKYYHDFVAPAKSYREPTAAEQVVLQNLAKALAELPEGSNGEIVQNRIYDFFREHNLEDHRGFFTAMYEILLGQSKGPRFGNFIALYGLANTIKRIEATLKN